MADLLPPLVTAQIDSKSKADEKVDYSNLPCPIPSEELHREAFKPYVRKIRDEKYGWKYGCGAKGCRKLFHAAEFVHKHLKLKHADLLVDSVLKEADSPVLATKIEDTEMVKEKASGQVSKEMLQLPCHESSNKRKQKLPNNSDSKKQKVAVKKYYRGEKRIVTGVTVEDLKNKSLKVLRKLAHEWKFISYSRYEREELLQLLTKYITEP